MLLEEITKLFNLWPRKVRGRDEHEIYKNYVADMPRENVLAAINHFIDNKQLIFAKDEKIYNKLNAIGKVKQGKAEYSTCLDLYTRSLSYAEYNSEKYANTLAIRSGIHYELKNYKCCIVDIDLCIQAGFSNVMLKANLLLRKAECCKNLGIADKMREAAVEAANLITSTNVTTSAEARYRLSILQILSTEPTIKCFEDERFDVVPRIEKNPTFLNASSSVALQHNKRKGLHVVAKKKIRSGEILFVEKAFAWTPLIVKDDENCVTNKLNHRKILRNFCEYCLATLTNPIPCKGCAEFLYCDEKCRDSAWAEFHQWECLAVQANFFNYDSSQLLALRIVLKAVHRGIVVGKKNAEELVANFGSEDNNYPYLFNMRSFLDKVSKEHLKSHAVLADILITYLEEKTNFFAYIMNLPAFADKTEQEAKNIIGGLIIRHRVQISSHSIRVATSNEDPDILDELTIAMAICPSMAMMNHCCLPNTSFYFIGDVVVVKALMDIKAGDEVCYSYHGAYLPRLPRNYQQTMVKTIFFSNCQCGLCTDPKMDMAALDSYLCLKCKGRTQEVVNNERQEMVCLNCSARFTLPLAIIATEEEAVESLHMFLASDDVVKAHVALDKFRSIYRSSNNIVLLIRILLQDYYKRKADIIPYLHCSKWVLESCILRNQWYTISNGLLRLSILKDALEILLNTWEQISLEQFDGVLTDLSRFHDEARENFSFHYPPFISHLKRLQGKLNELRFRFMERLSEMICKPV